MHRPGCNILCHGDLTGQLLLFISPFRYVLDDFSYYFSRILHGVHFPPLLSRTGSTSNIMQACSANNKECDRLTPDRSGSGLLPRFSSPLLTERLLIMLPQACCDWMLPSKPTCQCETGSP